MSSKWKGWLARWGIVGCVLVSVSAIGVAWMILASGGSHGPVLVVMDPLAKPLSCACVKGYAQRDYDVLGNYLGKRLGCRVRVLYAEELTKALRQTRPADVLLVIGKESVVKMDSAGAGLNVRPFCRLSDKNGGTDLTGLFAVKARDPAHSLADLQGRRILFGPEDSDEKHSAAIAALRKVGVSLPDKVETRPGCSDAAMDVQESTEAPLPACVISSYALPLLEGCGNIEKGSLRVMGATEPVPFITAFINSSLPAEQEIQIRQALSSASQDRRVLAALESRNGFLELHRPTSSEWPGWRGPNRDAAIESLPEKLPPAPKLVWKKSLPGPGLGGIAVAEGRVVFGGRDMADVNDVFSCLDAANGNLVWERAYRAAGQLDYGQSPRATPLLYSGKAYLLGAFGDLACVRLADGELIWELNLSKRFSATQPKWGFASSPLISEGKLVVNPGGTNASLVALDAATGKLIWSAPGAPAAYASFILGRFGGRSQIIGYDATSLGGWDPETGRRLWRLVPPKSGDFNVPTPLAWNGQLVVATENNGTRIYDFNKDGTIIPKPSAQCDALAPDVNTPVIAGGRLLGCAGELYCLDLGSGLKPLWHSSDEAFSDFVTLIGSKDRALLTSYRGELVLVSTTGAQCQVLSRVGIFDEGAEVFSHPALVNGRLYIRDNTSICCLELGGLSEGSSSSTVARRTE